MSTSTSKFPPPSSTSAATTTTKNQPQQPESGTLDDMSSSHKAPSYVRPSAPFYPLPYPVCYPPFPPTTLPRPQQLTSNQPHRYVVCRVCNTILLSLTNLPVSVILMRHFQDERPISIHQFFIHSHKQYHHHADTLMWLRRPFTGLFRYDASKDTQQSRIPLCCRSCQTSLATLIITFQVQDNEDEEIREEEEIGEGKMKSLAEIGFKLWAVSLSDAYGRDISAAAEARGFWNNTPAPYAGRNNNNNSNSNNNIHGVGVGLSLNSSSSMYVKQ